MFMASALKNAAFLVAGCAALLSPAAGATRGGVSTPLTLMNGWQNGPSGTANASVEQINGVVHFKGAISQPGGNGEPFVLPVPYRPAARVYIPIAACHAHNARLDISPGGDVEVETEGDFDKASCLISLDSASFALSTDGFKSLKLRHGWGPYGEDSGAAAVQTIDGKVTFEGAIATARKNPFPFVLATAYRPSDTLWVKLDLCDAHNGQLRVDPTGMVTVEVGRKWADAKCFTSLDGVSFAPKSNGFSNLALINGWVNFSAIRPAAVKLVNGGVQFEGTIDTPQTNSNANPFVLPSGFRPSNTVYLPLALCGGANGRLVIKPDGTTTIEAENDFGDAQCITSLEGVTFLR